MSKKTVYVLPSDHFRFRAPFMLSGVLYMALDLYRAPSWLWGVVGTLMALVWFAWACVVWVQKERPLPGYGEQRDSK